MALPRAGSGVLQAPLVGLQEDWARAGARRAAVAVRKGIEETILDT